MNKKEKTTIVLYAVFIFLLIGATIIYVRWQFNLCYPDVSDSVWYCLQHAF